MRELNITTLRLLDLRLHTAAVAACSTKRQSGHLSSCPVRPQYNNQLSFRPRSRHSVENCRCIVIGNHATILLSPCTRMLRRCGVAVTRWFPCPVRQYMPHHALTCLTVVCCLPGAGVSAVSLQCLRALLQGQLSCVYSPR